MIGLGRGLVEAYLARPNNTVVAAVRDPTNSSSKSLDTLPKGPNSHLITVKIDSSSTTDPAAAVKTLKEQHGITAVDVLIPNAAIAGPMPWVHEAKPDDMLEHYSVNVVAVVTLFTAFRPLLLAAASPERKVKVIPISSSAGSIGNIIPFHNSVYGTTKAALNFIARSIWQENKENMIVIPLDPG
jgi:norsolorinic acid ketoreductase